MLNLDPLRDIQETPPVGTCAQCGCELYAYDVGNLCEKCSKKPTFDEFMEAMDEELGKWLSDNLRDQIWNAMVSRFPAA